MIPTPARGAITLLPTLRPTDVAGSAALLPKSSTLSRRSPPCSHPRWRWVRARPARRCSRRDTAQSGRVDDRLGLLVP